MTLTDKQTEKLAVMTGDAEAAVRELRDKLYRSERGIKAAQWFAAHGEPKELQISTHTASGCTGYKEAMIYLNDLFQTFAADMMLSALENAGADMDAILHDPK